MATLRSPKRDVSLAGSGADTRIWTEDLRFAKREKWGPPGGAGVDVNTINQRVAATVTAKSAMVKSR